MSTNNRQPPMHLSYAESRDLRVRIEQAIAKACDYFVADSVTRDRQGRPVGGADPRAVQAEMALVLARMLARLDVDVANAAAFEVKLQALEAELAACTLGEPTVPALAEGSNDALPALRPVP